ncbi:MAG: DUF3581 family protein [Halofilum sp. (in: g-proteobacteria)]|nr:DUF3581 family protein [Halofilum sp. (in: g-proteobacteria)]
MTGAPRRDDRARHHHGFVLALPMTSGRPPTMNKAREFLAPFHTIDANGRVRITAEQASRFAKDVAGDHNPLHDVGTRRFCVPGDLLFALVLLRSGLSGRMTFGFRDMVGADESIHIPATDANRIVVENAEGGTCLDVEREGPISNDGSTIGGFIREYVAFSGKTFPHYMIPVMRDNGVMFHPDRPLVIYDSMGFELDHLDLQRPKLELSEPSMDVAGKRGEMVMRFNISADGRPAGKGWKKLLISGLREYDEARMETFVEEFYRRRAAYEEGRDAGDSEH